MPPEGLPSIVVEHISETRVPRAGRARAEHGSGVTVQPAGVELARRVTAALWMLKQDYARTIGTHRDFHPRMHSLVEHRIDRRADDALDALRRRATVDVRAGPLRLTGDATHVEYDTFEHEYRVACRLHLPWSWPELPMWLGISEASVRRGALRLSLRSRRRLRYPIRYFHAAHAVLTALESRLEHAELRCPSDEPSRPRDRRRDRDDHQQQP